MHKSRYVVMNQDGGWQIRNAYRHVTSIFPSKAQAFRATSRKGRRARSCTGGLVRHEDDRFITEWVYGDDLHPDDAARPAGRKQPGRSGA